MLLSKYLIVCFIAVFIDRQPNGPTLPPVVCRRAHGLFTLIVFVCVYWCQTHIVLWFFPSYCVPYVASFSGLSLFFCFVLCTLCCQFLWIVFGVFLRIMHPMLPVSLDCVVVFSVVLCTLCCQFLWIVFGFFLRIVYPMLPVSLDCVVVFSFVLCTLCCQFLWIVFVLLPLRYSLTFI